MAVSRYAAERGQTVRLGIKFHDPEGNLYDPYAFTQVEILAADLTVLHTFVASGIVRDATGLYYVDWAVPGAETLGKHYDKWYYTPEAGHDAVTATLEFYVYAAGTFAAADYYLSVTEARARCLISSPLPDDDIQYLIRLAMSIIDRVCGQHFLPVQETRYVDGTGMFYLPCDGPILELTAITNLDDSTATFTVADYRIRGTWLIHKDGRPWPRNQMDPPTGEAAVAYCSGTSSIFPYGFKNIAVEATWGLYAACPDPISLATCLLLKEGGKWDTVTAPMFANFASESVDGYAYTLRELFERAAVHNETGIPAIDGLLFSFLRKQFGGRVF